jgi:hypothetical protein
MLLRNCISALPQGPNIKLRIWIRVKMFRIRNTCGALGGGGGIGSDFRFMGQDFMQEATPTVVISRGQFQSQWYFFTMTTLIIHTFT